MRVLDLDLDLFLEDVCPLAEPGERPALEGHAPWEAEKVVRFLEDCCGLSRERPVPGCVFDTHDKALVFWQNRMREGRLIAPFTVTHADAHSDLGIGYPGTAPVLNGVLPVRFPERENLIRYYGRHQLDEANYLLFALGMRYVDRLENVRNPKSKRDMPPELLSDRKGYLHLNSLAAALLEGVNGREPEIAYEEYADPFLYRTKGPYDFMTVAVSPRYAPAEADALLEIIRSYMAEEEI